MTAALRIAAGVACATLTACACVTPGSGVPLVDLAWDQCAPLVTRRIDPSQQDVHTLFVTATGMTEPHTGYEARLWFATEMPCHGATFTPDAWRFDPQGCQAGRAELSITPPPGTCPALWGSGAEPVSVRLIAHEPLDGHTPPGAMRIVCAVTYPQSVQTPDPGQRYFLFAIRFDLTNAVAGSGRPGLTCGGLENPMCFALWAGVEMDPGNCEFGRFTHMHYTDTNGVEQPMTPGQGYATYGLDPSSEFSCFEVTKALPTTWGRLKKGFR